MSGKINSYDTSGKIALYTRRWGLAQITCMFAPHPRSKLTVFTTWFYICARCKMERVFISILKAIIMEVIIFMLRNSCHFHKSFISFHKSCFTAAEWKLIAGHWWKSCFSHSGKVVTLKCFKEIEIKSAIGNVQFENVLFGINFTNIGCE